MHRLLLVDGDAAVHELFSNALARDGRTIENAYDAAVALQRLKQTNFDVVLAGTERGGQSGLELLGHIRLLRPKAAVIVAGEEDRSAALESIRQRAYCYFHKPLQVANVVDMVRKALEAPAWRNDIRVISAKPDWLTLDIRCKLDAADRTTHFIRELETDLSVNAREDVAAAFRELLMNAIEHGAKSDPKKQVRTSLVRTTRALIVHIHDPGHGFSLDFLPHAAISNPDDSPTRHVEVRAETGKRPGGFGIMITRNLVDDLLYNEKGNAVLFVKNLK